MDDPTQEQDAAPPTEAAADAAPLMDGPPIGPDGPAPEAAAPHPPTAPRRRRSRARRLRRLALQTTFILTILLGAGTLIVIALTRAQPDWWTKVDANDPATIKRAEQIENGVASVLSSPRTPSKSGNPAEPWTVRLSADDANAWLNSRLRKWLLARAEEKETTFTWPQQLTELRVDFRDNRIFVGALVNQNGATQYFSASLKPSFAKDGALWLPADDVALGRLSIPASWVLEGSGSDGETAAEERTREVASELAKLPQTRQVLKAFAGDVPVLMNPVIRLADGRRVKLLGLTAKDGGLLITCRTLQRGEDVSSQRATAVEPPPIPESVP